MSPPAAKIAGIGAREDLPGREPRRDRTSERGGARSPGEIWAAARRWCVVVDWRWPTGDLARRRVVREREREREKRGEEKFRWQRGADLGVRFRSMQT